MSLSLGRSPLAEYRGRLRANGPGLLYSEPWPRRMRAQLAGHAVLDSTGGVIVYRTGAFPAHYFPLGDFDPAAIELADSQADGRQHWTVRVGERVARAALHGPTTDLQELGDASPVAGFATLDFGSMDRWFEEDEPLYGHIRDPYHRVDVRSSHRHVVVRLGDTVLCESSRPKLLFETSLPVRYYVPFADIALEYLTLSDTVSECPYKGDGQHWNVTVGDTTVTDAAWSLPHPLPEGSAAAEHVCFYSDRVDVTVDGEVLSS